MLDEWAHNSKECSLTMMRIFIKYAVKDREKILEKIEKLPSDLLSMVSRDVFEEFIKNLEKKLSKLKEEITTKKQRKFIHDFTKQEEFLFFSSQI
ncbi:hypothetical protein NDU88_002965 [Pleurodeles waltl]|uniref:Interferon gamma n=1 Tax=Pleurodeles waltl TaxID=8319 RepID=A0AAV7VG60_PLEWA|nr:hypothetical protein NDU88_002965 [Pleurodeles waltl]